MYYIAIVEMSTSYLLYCLFKSSLSKGHWWKKMSGNAKL
jgi:hypothetical protein